MVGVPLAGTLGWAGTLGTAYYNNCYSQAFFTAIA